MASLICWASGLLQVVPDKDVPIPGPVVLLTGTAGKLNSLMTAHGEFLKRFEAFYVPRTQDVPTEGRDDGAVQQDRMTLVIEFNKKLQRARAKQKGLKHLKEHDDANG